MTNKVELVAQKITKATSNAEVLELCFWLAEIRFFRGFIWTIAHPTLLSCGNLGCLSS